MGKCKGIIMDYQAFLTRVIDDGIVAAKVDYAKPEDNSQLRGSVEGFELCRGKQPAELRTIYDEANRIASEKALAHAEDYWFWRCRELEVEWVCNMVSAVIMNEGKPPLLSHLPTARAVIKAAEIVGVAHG